MVAVVFLGQRLFSLHERQVLDGSHPHNCPRLRGMHRHAKTEANTHIRFSTLRFDVLIGSLHPKQSPTEPRFVRATACVHTGTKSPVTDQQLKNDRQRAKHADEHASPFSRHKQRLRYYPLSRLSAIRLDALPVHPDALPVLPLPPPTPDQHRQYQR